MNKLFLTIALAFGTLVASAQFSVITTISENADSAWTITEKLGVGYDVNEKLMIGITMDGEDAYELLGRYDVYNGVWATCIYNYEKDSEAELKDKLELGLGYSFNVWKKLYVDPYYVMPMKENDEGKREGEFRLGISYKL